MSNCAEKPLERRLKKHPSVDTVPVLHGYRLRFSVNLLYISCLLFAFAMLASIITHMVA